MYSDGVRRGAMRVARCVTGELTEVQEQVGGGPAAAFASAERLSLCFFPLPDRVVEGTPRSRPVGVALATQLGLDLGERREDLGKGRTTAAKLRRHLPRRQRDESTRAHLFIASRRAGRPSSSRSDPGGPSYLQENRALGWWSCCRATQNEGRRRSGETDRVRRGRTRKAARESRQSQEAACPPLSRFKLREQSCGRAEGKGGEGTKVTCFFWAL